MYRFTLKLLAVTVVLTGAFLLLGVGGGRVAADSLPNNCGVADDQTGLPPVAYNGQSIKWGNDSDGEGAGVMASLIMKARDQSGNPLNPHFTINSSAGSGGDNAQIYHWPIGSGGSVSNSDNWPQHSDFQFGTTMHSADGSPVQCNGWVVLGPGTGAPGAGWNHIGNGWVLNCKTNGVNNKFWISHIDNPGGQPGKWQMLDSSGNTVDYDVNAGGPQTWVFPIANGTNMRFTFVWVPDQPPPHNPPSAASECSQATITDGGSATVNGKNFDSSDVRTIVRITDDSGQVMVHADGDQSGWLVLDNDSKTWYYQPRSPTVHVYVYRQYYHNTGTKDSNGNWIYAWDNYENDSRDHYNCFGASCWVDAVGVVGNVPNGPGNAVMENSQFQVTVHMQDTGVLSLGTPSVNGVGLVGNYLNTGDVSYTSSPITVTAPGGVQNAPITFTMNDGTFGSLGTCTVYVPVYSFFTLEPRAQLDYASPENPGPMTYSTSIINHASAQVTAPTHSEFSIKAYGGGTSYPAGPVDTSGPYNPSGPPNYTTGPGVYVPTPHAGDLYCSEIDFTGGYNEGYVGPGGAIVPSGLTTPGAKTCVTIINEPYFKVFNSGISAGGDFGCSSAGGTLAGYNDNTGADRGSGAQLSALALIGITGVASAQNAAPGAPTGLTFANAGAGVSITGSYGSPSLGGGFGGNRCLTGESMPPTAAGIGSSATVGSSVADGAYIDTTADLTLNGGNVAPGRNPAVFVTGHSVYISSNGNGGIKYSGGTAANPWTVASTSTTVPSFVLMVTGGNIYIDPSITQLDGTYIAASSGGAGGKIYTCASGFSPMPKDSMYNNCGARLTINGSFVADQINLGRTGGPNGSLRNSSSGDTATSNNAGEIFNFSPEMYLSKQSVWPPTGPSLQYKAWTNLPPVL